MTSLRSALAILALGTLSAEAQSIATPTVRVDWPAFLGRHDLVWDHLPTRWGESAFIGNGNLGATIFVRDSALSWTINQTTATHDQSRFPIGRVVLRTRGAQRGGSARLSLWDAEASGEVTTDSGTVRWSSFVSTTPSVIVIELEGEGGERDIALDWTPAEARPPRKVARKETFAPEDLHPPADVTRSTRGISSVQTFLGGGAHAEWIRREPSKNGRTTYYVTIGQSDDGPRALGAAAALVGSAEARGTASLRSNHRAWWHGYYPASFLSFSDARLEGYYWIQMYKLGSAMRENGPILDLNGPWYAATPWPAIWWNLNIQLTYSPLFRANRIPLSESLFRNLDRNTAALIANVPERLREDAAAIGRSSGPDLHRPVDLATATSDAAHEMGDLPWTMFYYWQYYRYTMDPRLLRTRVYPLLSRAINNYLGYVERGSDGRYHLPKTHSPELATVADANYDLALLRWGLQTLIASAEELHVADPHLPRWRDVLGNLTPFPADSTGLLVGRDRPWKESHRHYSHLLAVYPLGLITPDSASGRSLIERSLTTWEGVPSAFRGYSFTGGASMHAILGHGDSALVRLNRFLDAPRYMEPNTFYAEAGPVVETPLAAANTMQELFLQDWGGTLRVFHGTPTAWPTASFDKLRADGGFLVSGVRSDGRTRWVKVQSLAGLPTRLLVDDWHGFVVRAKGGGGARVSAADGGGVRLELAKGAWVVLSESADVQLVPVRPAPLERDHVWPTRATVTRGDLLVSERARVIAAAERYLREAPVTVTATRAPRSAGGSHDFYSEADYWWPDPSDSTKPYIRRDGETNPANFEAHRSAMRRLSMIVPALVAAYEITGDARYARHAIAHLRAWFVDDATRMNPSMLYAQAIKGVATGRGIGIIDTIHLVEVAQAALELERLGALEDSELRNVKSWFHEYVTWMTTHPYGIDERNNGNNHSAAWALQVAAFSRFTCDTAKLGAMRRFFTETLIPGQMSADGSFARELTRTKPYGYSLFQLDVMGMLAEALSTPSQNMWTFTTPDGRGMGRAMAFMAPYIENKATWPKPPDVMYHDAWPVRHPSLLFGGLALHRPEYIALWKRLDPDPTVDEVIRNYPVRQPLLWMAP
ncbi:MAG TPA: alginate lyase family protein [Gemmatimonadaceae bacterium]